MLDYYAFENEVMKTIKPELDNIMTSMSTYQPLAVCCATAIRSYGALRRKVNDIDFVLLAANDNLVDHLKKSFKFENIEIQAAGQFIRLKYPSFLKLEDFHDFRLDFHVGGYIHFEQNIAPVDAGFFKGSKMQAVPFGTSALTLPVPIPEELFILKLCKDKPMSASGPRSFDLDLTDLLAILECCSIDNEYACLRIKEKQLENLATKRLSFLIDEYDASIQSYEYEWGMSTHSRPQVDHRDHLAELRLMLQ